MEEMAPSSAKSKSLLYLCDTTPETHVLSTRMLVLLALAQFQA